MMVWPASRGATDMQLVMLATTVTVLASSVRVLARPKEGGQVFCASLAAKNNCHVFSCLDEQTVCLNSRTFRHSVLNTFCHQLHHRKNNLSARNKAWAQSSMNCIMQQMASYATNSNCPDVTGEVTRIFHTCAAANGRICEALRTDMAVLDQIFGERYWLDLVQAASHCPRRDVTRFVMAHLGL